MEDRNDKGQFAPGNKVTREGSTNKLTAKAKYLLMRYYEEIERQGIPSLVNDCNAADKVRAIIAGIPRNDNLNVTHSAAEELIDIIQQAYDKRKSEKG